MTPLAPLKSACGSNFTNAQNAAINPMLYWTVQDTLSRTQLRINEEIGVTILKCQLYVELPHIHAPTLEKPSILTPTHLLIYYKQIVCTYIVSRIVDLKSVDSFLNGFPPNLY